MNYTSVKGTQWSTIITNTPLDKINAIQHLFNLLPITTTLLASRFETIENIEKFLDATLSQNFPDPFHLKDMSEGVTRLCDAIQNKENICIYGDYDVDGGTATSIMYKFLKHIDVEPLMYIPDRLKEGYGLNKEAIQHLSSKNIQLIITVDTGTNAIEEINLAKQLGIDVIVIDHHISTAILPQALAIINPNRFDESSPHQYLSAVGVTFLFLVAMRSQLKKYNYSITDQFLFSLLDLVAMGTVCDVVPLIGLNRTLVTQGLKIMNDTTNVGLQALIQASGISNFPIKAEDIGFFLGPMINAGSRMENSYLAVNLLISEDEVFSKDNATYLAHLNNVRKAVEHEMYMESIEEIKNQHDNKKVIVVFKENWHVGVIGVIAGKLKEEFNKPVIICSFDKKDIGTGSCRSTKLLNIGELVLEAKNLGILISGGGHAMAAGLTIHKKDMERFQKWIEDFTHDILDYKPEPQKYDLEISTEEITRNLIDELGILEPYGNTNTEPIFLIKNLHVVTTRLVGDNKHVSCIFKCNTTNRNFKGIAFKSTHNAVGGKLITYYEKPISVIGKLRINSYQNRKTIQILIMDLIIT